MIDEWRPVRVAELGTIVTGSTPPSAEPELFGHEFPFLTPTDIDNNRRHVPTARRISLSGYERYRKRVLPPRSVCFVCIGSIGKICMTSEFTLTNQQINSVVVDEEHYDPDFVYYLLKWNTRMIQGHASGAATPLINKSVFSGISVLAPPLEVQRPIATVLAACDELIENNLRRIEILEDMADATYREWFVSRRFPGHDAKTLLDSPVGPIPEGWQVAPLEKAFRVSSGTTIKASDRSGGPTAVFGANGVIGFTGLTPNAPASVILGKIGSCGSLHRSAKPAWVTNNAFFVLPGLIESEQLIWHELQAINFRQFVGGTANPYMPLKNFGHHPIIIPEPRIQEAFEGIVATLWKLQANLRDQNANLATTRDLLLPKLVTGKHDLTDLDIDTSWLVT